VLFYFITFTPKCLALAVAAVSAELTAIMRNKACKFYAHDTLAGNSHRKLTRVIRRWKLANVTCFPALVFISRGNLA